MLEIKRDLERDVSLDFCRCISCIAVVIIHTIAPYWYSTPVLLQDIHDYVGGILTTFSKGWMLCSIIDALIRFSVPLFVIVNGALMLNRSVLNLKYVFKKVMRLIFNIVF